MSDAQLLVSVMLWAVALWAGWRVMQNGNLFALAAAIGFTYAAATFTVLTLLRGA